MVKWLVMSKIAVFVEGQAELIFLKDFLWKYYSFNTEEVGYVCYNLHACRLELVPYGEVGDVNSKRFFQIINVGNDASVLSVMLQRADKLFNTGFQRIIGLRDMYSDPYHAEVKNRKINEKVNRTFIESANDEIKARGLSGIELHFAIMEFESWLLGLLSINDYFLKTDFEVLRINNIYDSSLDPEGTYYHPSEVLKSIAIASGCSYDKHAKEIYSIVSHLSKEDYLSLVSSGKCASFASFVGGIS